MQLTAVIRRSCSGGVSRKGHAHKRAPDSALRDWALKRTDGVSRIQKNRIVIGLARKLGVLMLHLLKTKQDFKPYPRGGAPKERELEFVRVPMSA